MLRVPGTRTLRIAASVGLPHDVVTGADVQMGQGISGFVAHTGRSMLIKRRRMPAVARLFKQKGSDLTSSLVLPVRYGREIVGVINLSRGPGRLSFTEADRTWVGKLAEQVAPLLSEFRARNKEWLHGQARPQRASVPQPTVRTQKVPAEPVRPDAAARLPAMPTVTRAGDGTAVPPHIATGVGAGTYADA
jgi:signal transduction protein with GAF and PtsI domain